MDGNDAHLFLFGATGDLAAKKILPALQQWAAGTPFFSRIWCFGRRPFDTPAYLAFIEKKGRITIEEPLLSAIRYQQLDFNDPAALWTGTPSRPGISSGTRRLFSSRSNRMPLCPLPPACATPGFSPPPNQPIGFFAKNLLVKISLRPPGSRNNS